MSFGTFFLHAPERFPDASQGVPWGAESLRK